MILYQNNEVLKLDQYCRMKIEQETIVNKAEEKVNNLNKMSHKSQESNKLLE